MVIMVYEQICPKCGKKMTKIPIQRLDSTLIIEFYCNECDESITFYPEKDKIEIKKPDYF